jgi:hypothetical protein
VTQPFLDPGSDASCSMLRAEPRSQHPAELPRHAVPTDSFRFSSSRRLSRRTYQSHSSFFHVCRKLVLWSKETIRDVTTLRHSPPS